MQAHYLADAVLATHVLFVAFVVLGLFFVIAGGILGWAWVRNFKFRVTHLFAIGIVVVQAWAGVLCPLTSLEMVLRENSQGSAYSGSFIGHWLDELLYFEAPPWVFTLCYSVFGVLVVLAWVLVRPVRRTQRA